jgi:hypothetical protein
MISTTSNFELTFHGFDLGLQLADLFSQLMHSDFQRAVSILLPVRKGSNYCQAQQPKHGHRFSPLIGNYNFNKAEMCGFITAAW